MCILDGFDTAWAVKPDCLCWNNKMNRRQPIYVVVLHSFSWSTIVEEATMIHATDWGRDQA